MHDYSEICHNDNIKITKVYEEVDSRIKKI